MPFSDEESSEMLSSSSLNQFDHSETIDVEHMDEDEVRSDSSSHFETSGGGGGGGGSSNNSHAGASSSSSSCRNPTCALCKNHHINSPLKGHKRYCPFGRCGCDLCRITRRKQKINASQVASRRALQQDRELGIERPTMMQASTSSGSSTPKTHSSSVSPHDAGRSSANRSTLDVERPLIREHPTSSSQTVLSQYTPGGPVVFGENMSLECFLLGRNASLLLNALRESRFSTEQLAYLDHDVCTAIRIIREEVSPQVNDIYKYLLDRLQREQFSNGTKTSNLSYVVGGGGGGNQFPISSEPAIHNAEDVFHAAQTLGHSSRDTVICPPRMLPLPMYNPYFNP